MKRKKGIVGAGVVLIIILVLVLLQSYAKRSIQGRLRSAADDIGWQYLATEYRVWTEDESQSYVVRKLIRNATINLKVEDSEKTLRQIIALINGRKGVIVDSQLNKNSHQQKSGTAIVKVLPKDFDETLQELRKLGEVEYEKTSSEDVTEKYIDLEARLKNFTRVRNRLIKILEERAREVKDILDVERELARVGAEIEALEGKIKYLDRQVGLATITVTFYENRIAILGSLNFTDKFKRTLQASVEVSVNVFNGIIIFIAALLPLLLWGGGITGIVLGIRKLVRKK